jgi:hypothetical protein
MPKKKVPLFHCTKPCRDCPYRTDAPLRLWAREEFEGVLESEGELLGRVYQCHGKTGSVCVGWLMNQDERGFPSIALRVALMRHEVTRDYLDSLRSPAPLYKSVQDIVRANFPELLGSDAVPEFRLIDLLNAIASSKI